MTIQDIDKTAKIYADGYLQFPVSAFLKFFSVFYDEEAIRSGIIEKENVVPFSLMPMLLYKDTDYFNLLRLDDSFCLDTALYIVNALYSNKIIAKGVNPVKLTEYLVSRWNYPWGKGKKSTEILLPYILDNEPTPCIVSEVYILWKVANAIVSKNICYSFDKNVFQ